MLTLIPQWVAHHAAQRPAAPAIIFRDTTLSWKALDTLVDQLAGTLFECGIRRGDRIGIFMDKSEFCAVAIYGIMRAGAAYVPLDPAAPVERLADIVKNCGIEILVSRPEKRRVLAGLAGSAPSLRCVIGIDEASLQALQCISWETVAKAPERLQQPVKVLESDLAYIIYTSGSTGVPKGIMHTHHSGLAFAHWAADEYGLNRSDRLSNHAPLHFDLSILDYFSSAIVGACTVIIPEEYTRLPASYSELIATQSITVLYTVPFALIQLLQRGVIEQRDLSALRWVIFGGEPYPVKHLVALMKQLPHARFDNIYGPAEVNGCTHFTVPADFPEDGRLPIGPIASIAEDLIVGDDDMPCGVGEIGELLVRTPTMMRGYWQRPDLNAQAFFYRESHSTIREVFFRTGDLVEADGSGLLYFCGRKDRQVKVRGYRIELDEIEAAITALDGIEESAVFTVPDPAGSQTLLAVVLPEPGSTWNEASLTAQLRSSLPKYAVPSSIEIRNDFPRTSTGKIDRIRLKKIALEAGQ